MRRYSGATGVMLCVLFAFAAYHLPEVDTTPLPPRLHENGKSYRNPQPAAEKKNQFSENHLRTKRGIPCSRVDDTDYEWEISKPCGCDPCEAVRDATEARMLRKQHRKIVAEMKMNRLKRKLHNAVCPSCALAHEREAEQMPCTKPHVDITVVVPGANPHGGPEDTSDEYPMLPPPRETYAQVIQTASTVTSIEPEQPMMEPEYEPMVPEPHYIPEYVPMRPEPQYGSMRTEPQYGSMRPEPQYGSIRPQPQYRPMQPEYEPMRPEPQYGPMWSEPQYGPMRPETQYRPMQPEYEPMRPEPHYGHMRPEPQYGPMRPQRRPFIGVEPIPWMRSAADIDSVENEDTTKDNPEKDVQSNNLLQKVFEKTATTTEAPIDSDEAWPWRNATYNKDTEEGLPNDSGEAVPFNYTGILPPRGAKSNQLSSGGATPFNYTGSLPREPIQVPMDETALRAPPIDEVIWQTAYNAALKALSNNSSLPVRSSKDCSGGQCKCLGDGCLENEATDSDVGLRLPPPSLVRGKRSTSFGMPIASALFTGLVSAIIGA